MPVDPEAELTLWVAAHMADIAALEPGAADRLADRDGAELLVLAFPGGRGTASCIREARQWYRFSGGEVRMQLLQLPERIEASTRS